MAGSPAGTTTDRIDLGIKTLTDGARYASPADAVFLLSDGEPTSGWAVDPVTILQLIRERNRYSRLRIHTIFMGAGGDSVFMQQLENKTADGTSVFDAQGTMATARRSATLILRGIFMIAKRPTLLVFVACSFGLSLPAQQGAEKKDQKSTQQDEERALAGHSEHGEVFNEGARQKAYLMDGCGEIVFPIRSEQEVSQKLFLQGVGQLHGFWDFEAERSFRQIAAMEPNCAMAYWGMAMANVDNPDRAAGFVDEAVLRRQHASERGQDWIDTLANFYEVTVESAKERRAKKKPKTEDATGKPEKRKYEASKKDRSQGLADDYRALMKKYPDHDEPIAFLVNRVWLNRKARIPTKDHEAMEDLLKKIFKRNPMHPAHHYRIHLWDREDAARALPSAALSGQSSPAIAHQWHMSGHIFAKLHRHEDAAWQQAASARVDHAHMMRDRVMPYQIHNFGHNNEWLVRSLAHSGRPEDAIGLARNMVELPRHPEKNRVERRSSIAGYGTTKLIETCRKYLMVDVLKELEDLGYFVGGASVSADLAAAYLEMGEIERGKAHLAKSKSARPADAGGRRRGLNAGGGGERAAEGRGDRRSGDRGGRPTGGRRGGRRGRGARRGAELEGLLALAEGRLEDAKSKLKNVTMSKLYFADVSLALGDVTKARDLIDAEAKKSPNRAEIMARQIRILIADEDEAEARKVFDRLREVAGHGDIDAPLFARLSETAAKFGYPRDWRLPADAATDVGIRPDLDELGPFEWSPSPALDWTLPGLDGEGIGLRKNYKGKNVLLIFYLGFGCLHCVEQLQHFHPMAEKNRDAGIEIVAIGTDSVAGMTQSLMDLDIEDRFAFPLVADPKLEVFKQWRAFDDFENMALHGTFLVDGEGMVRWQDISYEPFDEPEWLLKECKRLLRLKSRKSSDK